MKTGREGLAVSAVLILMAGSPGGALGALAPRAGRGAPAKATGVPRAVRPLARHAHFWGVAADRLPEGFVIFPPGLGIKGKAVNPGYDVPGPITINGQPGIVEIPGLPAFISPAFMTSPREAARPEAEDSALGSLKIMADDGASGASSPEGRSLEGSAERAKKTFDGAVKSGKGAHAPASGNSKGGSPSKDGDSSGGNQIPGGTQVSPDPEHNFSLFSPILIERLEKADGSIKVGGFLPLGYVATVVGDQRRSSKTKGKILVEIKDPYLKIIEELRLMRASELKGLETALSRRVAGVPKDPDIALYKEILGKVKKSLGTQIGLNDQKDSGDKRKNSPHAERLSYKDWLRRAQAALGTKGRMELGFREIKKRAQLPTGVLRNHDALVRRHSAEPNWMGIAEIEGRAVVSLEFYDDHIEGSWRYDVDAKTGRYIPGKDYEKELHAKKIAGAMRRMSYEEATRILGANELLGPITIWRTVKDPGIRPETPEAMDWAVRVLWLSKFGGNPQAGIHTTPFEPRSVQDLSGELAQKGVQDYEHPKPSEVAAIVGFVERFIGSSGEIYRSGWTSNSEEDPSWIGGAFWLARKRGSNELLVLDIQQQFNDTVWERRD